MRSSATRRSKILDALADDLSFVIVGQLAADDERTRDLAAALNVGPTDVTKRIRALEAAGIVARGTPAHRLVQPAQTLRVLRETDRLAMATLELELETARLAFMAREDRLQWEDEEDEQEDAENDRHYGEFRRWSTGGDWQHTGEPGYVVLSADEGVLLSEEHIRGVFNLDYLPFVTLVAGLAGSGNLSRSEALAIAQCAIEMLAPLPVWEQSEIVPPGRHWGWRDATAAVFESSRLAAAVREARSRSAA